MNQPNTQSGPEKQVEVLAAASRINDLLKEYSDKDWNYSRITLEKRLLGSLSGPYSLWIDFLATNTKQGHADFQTYSQEISWGGRHSNELGILEIISLRLNKALIDLTTDETWQYRRPVVRLIKKEELVNEGVTDTIWYQVTEVIGEDFDNR